MRAIRYKRAAVPWIHPQGDDSHGGVLSTAPWHPRSASNLVQDGADLDAVSGSERTMR